MYSWITDFYSLHSIHFCMCAQVKIGAKGRGGGGGGGRVEEEGGEGGGRDSSSSHPSPFSSIFVSVPCNHRNYTITV